MKGNLPILTFLFCLIFLNTHAQTNETPAERYFHFVNNYEKDSLQNLLSDNFQLQRTFARFTNDKSSFLDSYLEDSKALNAKYRVIRTISGNEPKQFLVNDESDALKYLGIVSPTWKITIKTKGEQVENVLIDTTETYPTYLADISLKEAAFWLWMKNNYTDETEEMLYNDRALLAKRMKEYSKKKK